MFRKLCLLSAAFVPLTASGVTFTVDADRLDDANGDPMPASGLVVLLASTTDDLSPNGTKFADPSSDSFFNGDDILLGKLALLNSGEDAGVFGGQFTFTLAQHPGLDVGDDFQLYWYPTLTVSDTAPGPNTPYGRFRSDDPEAVNRVAWEMQPESSDPLFTGYSLGFFTLDGNPANNGIRSAAAGDATNFTPVPEPSTYAGAFALCCLAWAFASKRLKRGDLA